MSIRVRCHSLDVSDNNLVYQAIPFAPAICPYAFNSQIGIPRICTHNTPHLIESKYISVVTKGSLRIVNR